MCFVGKVRSSKFEKLSFQDKQKPYCSMYSSPAQTERYPRSRSEFLQCLYHGPHLQPQVKHRLASAAASKENRLDHD